MAADQLSPPLEFLPGGSRVLLEAVLAQQPVHARTRLAYPPDLTTGVNPFGRLVQGRDGALYGSTTSYPFTGSRPGVIFRLNLDGSGFQVLHRFGSVPGDGAAPVFGVIQGSDGYLYGNTRLGGTLGFGTIFRLTKDGTEYTVLRSFRSSPNADGAEPQSGLIEGQDGRLYGTTSSGGTGFVGTLFTINRDGGAYAILRHFTAPRNGPSAFLASVQGRADKAVRAPVSSFLATALESGPGATCELESTGACTINFFHFRHHAATLNQPPTL